MAVYHRLRSSSQSLQTAVLQTHSNEVWGTAAFQRSGIASVKAYFGPLPDGAAGIEFETDMARSAGTSTLAVAYWYEGLTVGIVPTNRLGFVALSVEMRKVVYPNSNPALNVSCVF